ncbi:MAG: hypothetical protein E7294_13970 [Lachnospiraceae bacterium]|nr:hypothetical protein [Lachnospiraceae bacterium]
MTTVTDANGNSTTYEYDMNGNCSATVDALGNCTEYAYDGMGQILSMTRKEIHI